jgi:hypothetical protein
MQDLTIAIQPHKRDETPKTKDRRNISVQPSSKVKNGVFFSFNDHHEIVAGENDRSTAAEIALRIIEQHWQSSWDDAVRVFEGVLERTLKS